MQKNDDAVRHAAEVAVVEKQRKSQVFWIILRLAQIARAVQDDNNKERGCGDFPFLCFMNVGVNVSTVARNRVKLPHCTSRVQTAARLM